MLCIACTIEDWPLIEKMMMLKRIQIIVEHNLRNDHLAQQSVTNVSGHLHLLGSSHSVTETEPTVHGYASR